MSLIDATLNQLTLGDAVHQFRNLTVFPLLAGKPVLPDYLTLDQALQEGQVAYAPT